MKLLSILSQLHPVTKVPLLDRALLLFQFFPSCCANHLAESYAADKTAQHFLSILSQLL
ncbi:MAG: hypothetical protein N3E41_08850 [Thermofilaceae archaeon]|nr:hypothetical protein [Thermofilaceae archaeon]